MASELTKSMVLDGVACSTAIDSSGEQIDLDGLDISELEQGLGVLNYEHRGDKDTGASSNDIIGAITFAKKIYGLKDCSNDRERSYWERVKLPFLYIKAELFNDEGHPGAVAAASLIRYYNRRKLPILMRYSIEGSTLEREGAVLKRCIARRVAATLKPCNRTCFSGVLSDTDSTVEESSSDLKSLARNEASHKRRLGSFELEYNPVVADPTEILKNSLESLKEAAALSKAIAAGGYDAAPSSLSGGSALQVEDVSGGRTLRNRALAAKRDWDRKTDFRKFLKSRLPEASDGFIDHFVKLVDQFHLKKQEALETELVKAVTGTLALPEAPAEGHLTVQGRALPPINVPGAIFDEREGCLITPRGSFKTQIPSLQGGNAPVEYAKRLGDRKASAFHSYVAGNWARLHTLSRQGAVPQEILLHTALFNKLSPTTPVESQDFLYGQMSQLGPDQLPSDGSRYLAAMRGAGDGLITDPRLVAHLFGLDAGLDAESIRYANELLNDPAHEPVISALGRYFTSTHDAVRCALEDPRLKDVLQDESHGCFAGMLRAWMAADDIGTSQRPFWDAVGEFTGLPATMKSEGDLPLRTAQLQREWCKKYGEIPALMLYHAYIVPQLLHAAASRSVLGKMSVLADSLRKAANEVATASALAPLAGVPANAHKFQGQHVLPGEVEVLAGPHKGSKLHLVGEDSKHHYVKAHTDDPDAAIQVSKLSKDKEGMHYRVNNKHQKAPGSSQVHAEIHGHPTHNQTDAQKHLMHGLDLESPVSRRASGHKAGTTEENGALTGWYQSAHGKTGYVKGEAKNLKEHTDKWNDPEEQKQIPVPEREAIYHNLARDFFGLGSSVPATATFKHPKTGEKMSVIERVPGGIHYDSDDDAAQSALHQAGETGHLDKMAMMDAVLGQDDRHDGNYMLTEHAPFLHHIDNGLMFRHGTGEKYFDPDYMRQYWNQHPTLKSTPGHKSIKDTPIHPEAAKWVLGLDPNDLHARLLQHGVPPKLAATSASKLKSMQDLMWSGQPKRGDIFKIGGQ